MRKRDMYPIDIFERTSLHHSANLERNGSRIYLVVLASLAIATILLPIISISVSVKSAGLLHAATQVNIIRASGSGVVRENYIHENCVVKKGDLLFSVESNLLNEKERHLKNKITESAIFLKDLQVLSLVAKTHFHKDIPLTTRLYQQAWVEFNQKLSQCDERVIKAFLVYDRNNKLFTAKVISAVEFEDFKFDYTLASAERGVLIQSTLNTWIQESRNLEKEHQDIQSQLTVAQREKENLQIYSPVNGRIQNLSGIYQGTPIFTNQELGQISPDTTLIAEVYVSPDNIGLLKTGMSVNLQINAFNFHQWGLLAGKVVDISDDILIRDNRPFFKVTCSLSKDCLQLKNGHKGILKKGMTVTCRFLVSERSLWQLIYDKADNWLNPDLLPEKPLALR